MRQHWQRSIGVVLCLMLTVSCVIQHAYAQDRKLKELPLFQPADLNAVKQWGKEAILNLYTYDFVNYRRQTGQGAKFFTKDGWHSYSLAFRKSDNLQTVIKEQLIATANIMGPVEVLQQGIKDNVYYWHLRYRVITRYTNNQRNIKLPLLITLYIKRTQREGYQGLGITTFLAVLDTDDKK